MTVTVEEIETLLAKMLQDAVPWWKQSPLWQGWATKLDNTHLWYMLPIEYNILCKLTEQQPIYLEANIADRITLYFLGTNKQLAMPAGEIWQDEWKDGLPEKLASKLDEKEKVLIHWAERLWSSLKENRDHWDKAYKDGLVYFLRHRHLVRSVGKLLEESMEDHDLTKTNLVLYALAYSWYWPEERDEVDTKLARAVIHKRHLAQEDHHPEFESGVINPHRLFCDRLAVHIQKNPGDDEEFGWKIVDWIPETLRPKFEEFHAENKDNNLYEIRTYPELSPAMFEIEGQNKLL